MQFPVSKLHMVLDVQVQLHKTPFPFIMFERVFLLLYECSECCREKKHNKYFTF